MRRLVIGVGNPDRGDDAAGPAVANALNSKVSSGISVTQSRGEPASLLDQWADADAVFVIDACTSDADPGTVTRFKAHKTPLPEYFDAVSTHGFGLGATVELARAMDILPASLIVYGIEAASFEPGASMSPPVENAVAIVATQVLSELNCD